MTNAFRFDHLIIAVDDLNAAMADYQSLGFTVYYGGRHASGTTHNALISLSDGSYLELIARTGSEPIATSATDFAWFLNGGERIAGYALCAEDLRSHVDAMREAGLTVAEPKEGQRVREDGFILKWKLTSVDGSISPLLLEDITPRSFRVLPHPDLAHQANGVIGVQSITVIIADLQEGINFYKALLGVPPLVDHTAAHFRIGPSRLVITLPEDDAMRQHLARWGRAPYEVVLKAKDNPQAMVLDMARTHQARIRIVP